MKKVIYIMLIVIMGILMVSCNSNPADKRIKNIEQELIGKDFYADDEYYYYKGSAAVDTVNYPVKAQALLMAKEAAKVIAYDNAVSIITENYITSSTTVKNRSQVESEVMKVLQGTIKGATVYSSGVTDDGAISYVWIRIPKKIIDEKLKEIE